MGDATLITIYVALVLSGLLINPLKDKWGVALLSLFVPFIGIVGWFRLGKPDSFWARRFYGPDKMARALNRYPREMPGSQILAPESRAAGRLVLPVSSDEL